MIWPAVKEVARAALRGLVDDAARAVARRLRRSPPEGSQPLTWRDIEHIRRQQASAARPAPKR